MKFSEMISTEVLELANDVYVARSSLNSTRAEVLLAQARLLSAMGALGYDDLLPGNERYDPESHFDKVKSNGDFPAITPVVRAIDSLATKPATDRPVRDPASAVAVGTPTRQ